MLKLLKLKGMNNIINNMVEKIEVKNKAAISSNQYCLEISRPAHTAMP